MESDCRDITVVGTTTLSASQPPTSLQPSGRDVAVRFSIPIDGRSSWRNEEVIVLLYLLQGITENTCGNDVLALGMYRAQDLCRRAGVDEETYDRVLQAYAEFAEKSKRNFPKGF